MTLEANDINLDKFLEKFTFTNEQGKIQIPVETWIKVASLLKIDVDLQRLVRK